VLGTINVVGGFVVTDRMLEMFSKKKKQAVKKEADKSTSE
jgi:NAD/NADP transhydrogenase alpha subunit